MNSDRILKVVRRQVHKNLEEQIELTRKLVQIPSVTGQEDRAQTFMFQQYEETGLDTKILEVDFETVCKHPAYCGFGEQASAYEGRPNVVAKLSGNGKGRSLILNGHVDVVSPEPVEHWKYDPWEARIEGDRIYGRGTNDMKAGLIANLMAVKCLLNLGLEPAGDIILQSVIEEEAGGGGGTLALLLGGYTSDGAIITEPTNLGVRIGSGGVLYFRLTVSGRTAHAGNAHLGINAISHLIPIYQALERLGIERGNQRAPLFEKGSHGKSCHLNLGVLKAGDWPSTVPGKAILEGRVGFLPGETAHKIKKQIEDTVNMVAQNDNWLRSNPVAIDWFGFRADPWLEDKDSQLVKIVREAITLAIDEPVDVHARASAVDNRFFPFFDCPTLCLGTCGYGNHAIDEYVEISSLGVLSTALVLSALNWCKHKEK